MIQYPLILKKFLNSQYVYTGVRITVGVLVPAMVLYHFGLLGVMMGIPLGALFIALPDNPGPLHHRINGMIAGIFLNFLVVVVAGYSMNYDWLIGVEIAIFTFFFAMFGVYGARADSIGLVALIAFILSYGVGNTSNQPAIYTALYFAAGGAWYAMLSIVFSGIQPYKPVQQLLGEYLLEIGDYLQERSKFYDKNNAAAKVLMDLFPKQAVIQKHQIDLREILFKTRLFIRESTNKGRGLMMIFLESTDLLERIITAQQNYDQLHKDFDDTSILQQFGDHIRFLGHQLQLTGVAVQSGGSFVGEKAINNMLEKSNAAFFELRNQKLKASNIESFITLRHILYSLVDVSDRVKRLQGYTRTDKKIKKQVNREELQAFVSHQDLGVQQLLSNLSLNSGQFRHALRLTAAMLAGYILSLLFPLGHSYWILLTVATILKPAFSTSRKRNIHRVGGTLIGVGVGFIILFFTANATLIFIAMLAGMLIAYSTLRLNYLVSTAALTLYIVLSFHFLYGASLNTLLFDRVIDTVAGSIIAIVAAYFILPKWEYEQFVQQLEDAAITSGKYFAAVTELFKVRNDETMFAYKLSRKSAFVSLANLADGFQRMLDEPKSRQVQLEKYHQLVASNHMLTSYIASLAYLAERSGEYDVTDLRPMLQYISRQFDILIRLLQEPGLSIKKQDPFPVSKKIQELLQQRRSELGDEIAREKSPIRQRISVMKALSDQLQLVNSVLEEEIRILSTN